jgi:hypothetical protein
MWLQTSFRSVLNLVPTHRVLQPFASKFALSLQVKCLHQSDAAAVKSENDESSTVDQRKLEAQKETLDAKSTKGEPGLAKDKDDYTATPRYPPGLHPNSIAARKKS